MDTSSNRSICLVAGGLVTALGCGEAPLREALHANSSALRLCDHLATGDARPPVAGAVPQSLWAQLRANDPAHADATAFLLADAALRQAEAQLDFEFESVPPARRALVLSSVKADATALERCVRREPCSPVARRHVHSGWLARDLAAARGVQGPVQTVALACISGLVALQQGAALLTRGTADLVFVAGVDLLSRFALSGFTTLKSLDPEGCRPFDRSRVGLSLGEGAAVVVLARDPGHARRCVRLSGWGTSNDANHLTGPSRDGAGLALAIQRALAQAGVTPGQVDYAHMHGTGTPYNDAMESQALRAVFGDTVPPYSSSKGMLGHTLGAAGLVETLVCHIALQEALLPGTPRLKDPDPIAPASVVVAPRPAVRLQCVLKVNCGFGGTNGAVVLQQPAPS